MGLATELEPKWFRRRSQAEKRIAAQFDIGQSPERSLMWQVVRFAIMDLDAGDRKTRYEARQYLLGPMYHAELCGVEAEWIRQTLHDLDVWLDY